MGMQLARTLRELIAPHFLRREKKTTLGQGPPLRPAGEIGYLQVEYLRCEHNINVNEYP